MVQIPFKFISWNTCDSIKSADNNCNSTFIQFARSSISNLDRFFSCLKWYFSFLLMLSNQSTAPNKRSIFPTRKILSELFIQFVIFQKTKNVNIFYKLCGCAVHTSRPICESNSCSVQRRNRIKLIYGNYSNVEHLYPWTVSDENENQQKWSLLFSISIESVFFFLTFIWFSCCYYWNYLFIFYVSKSNQEGDWEANVPMAVKPIHRTLSAIAIIYFWLKMRQTFLPSNHTMRSKTNFIIGLIIYSFKKNDCD